jgi:hypothetical protein
MQPETCSTGCTTYGTALTTLTGFTLFTGGTRLLESGASGRRHTAEHAVVLLVLPITAGL